MKIFIVDYSFTTWMYCFRIDLKFFVQNNLNTYISMKRAVSPHRNIEKNSPTASVTLYFYNKYLYIYINIK